MAEGFLWPSTPTNLPLKELPSARIKRGNVQVHYSLLPNPQIRDIVEQTSRKKVEVVESRKDVGRHEVSKSKSVCDRFAWDLLDRRL